MHIDEFLRNFLQLSRLYQCAVACIPVALGYMVEVKMFYLPLQVLDSQTTLHHCSVVVVLSNN